MDEMLKLGGAVLGLAGILGVVVRWLMAEVTAARTCFLASLATEREESRKDREYDREVRKLMHGILERIAGKLESQSEVLRRIEGRPVRSEDHHG